MSPVRRPTRRRPADRQPSAVRPHAFHIDRTVPHDRRGRSYCLWCHLPGKVGDERHPVDAPSLLPLVPDDARELDARILGEFSRA